MAKGEEFKNWDCEAWYLRRTKAKACEELKDVCERAMVENCYRATRAYRFASKFQGYTLTNLSSFGADMSVADKPLAGWDAPLIKNRLPQLCKSFVAKSFANDSPLPQFTTKGGDYEQTLKAETLDQAIATEYSQEHGSFSDVAELHRHGALIAASSTGTYFVFCIDYDNATRPEAELDDSLTIGIFRAHKYGAIRMLLRTIWMLPEEAIRKFGKKFSEQIYANLEPRDGQFMAGRPGGGLGGVTIKRREVRVHMGWAVQVGDEPGRQMFCLKDGKTILRDRAYTKPKPPCVFWHYEADLDGEWGTPLTQHVFLLSQYQNRILNDVDTAERKTSQVVIAVQKGTQGAKAMTSQVVNTQAVQVIEVDGPVDSAMKIFESPKFSKDSLGLEAVYDNAQFEDSGIPRNHAMGTKAAGATSGIHESLSASYYTENFADAERRAIQVRAIGTATIFLWVLQSLAEKGFERWIGDKSFRRLIKSTDLDLDEDKYITEIKAVGEGKDSPASRLEKAEKWLNNPAVEFNGGNMVEMFKTFDVKRAEQRANAIDEWVKEQVERWRKAPVIEMRKPDFYQPPERWFQVPQLKDALTTLAFEYLQARQDKVPDNRLAWFEKFGNECTVIIEAEEARLAALQNGMPPPGGMPPMGGGAPPGAGAPPPPGGLQLPGGGAPPGALAA
jgi:hypothetical protein